MNLWAQEKLNGMADPRLLSSVLPHASTTAGVERLHADLPIGDAENYQAYIALAFPHAATLVEQYERSGYSTKSESLITDAPAAWAGTKAQ